MCITIDRLSVLNQKKKNKVRGGSTDASNVIPVAVSAFLGEKKVRERNTNLLISASWPVNVQSSPQSSVS